MRSRAALTSALAIICLCDTCDSGGFCCGD